MVEEYENHNFLHEPKNNENGEELPYKTKIVRVGNSSLSVSVCGSVSVSSELAFSQ